MTLNLPWFQKSLCWVWGSFLVFLGMGDAFAVNLSELSAVEYQMAPIIKNSLSGVLLSEDEIVPSVKGSVSPGLNGGSIQNAIVNRLGVSVTEYGHPGMGAQVRGLGTSSEDVDVQALGVSLNPPQGGGFDLGQFPQFLWSDFEFQNGPSLGGLNPVASAGTLKLTPWTLSALEKGDFYATGKSFFSSLGVNQFSAGGAYKKRIAWVGGYSSLKVRGPALGLSARWGQLGAKNFGGFRYSGQVHFLGADLDSDSPGSLVFQTPGARLRKQRWIPLLENEFYLNESMHLSSSFYLDRTDLDYADPGRSFYSNSTSFQWGTQNIFSWNQFKFGMSFKEVTFRSDYVVAPTQEFVNFLAARDFEFGASRLFLLQPNLQAIWVSELGWIPQGSLGARYNLPPGSGSLFGRVGYSQKVPSLLDRYSPPNPYGMRGNAALKPEIDWTTTLGWDAKPFGISSVFKIYGQYRQDARVLTSTSLINLGEAFVFASSMDLSYLVTSGLNLEHHLTWSQSRLFSTGHPFPYLSDWIGVFSIRVDSKADFLRPEWVTSVRWSGSRTFLGSSPETLPPYLVIDMGLQLRMSKNVLASIRVENLLDHVIEVQKDFPIGRSVSLQVVGEL